MAILEILHYPDNRLRQKCQNVEIFDDSLKEVVKKMLKTMYSAKGIGLAAIQVNIIKRIIVIDISEDRNNPMVLINPAINSYKDKIQFEEGCLSVPGFYEKIERYNKINFTACKPDGSNYNSDAEGLLAVCIQHEIDHLNGKLFVDYLSSLKRDRITKKIIKMQNEGIKIERDNVPYNL